MTAKDPWEWTIDEVTQFTRQHLQAFASGLPNAILPDCNTLADRFQQCDVTGYALLSAVTSEFLRDECGVSSLAARAAVLHAIGSLKALSLFGHSTQSDPRTTPGIPLLKDGLAGREQSSPERISNEQIVLEQVSPVRASVQQDLGVHARSGEVLVRDRMGRKRRRLALTVSVEPPASLAASHSQGYLSDKKLSVDEVFYDRTLIGRPIAYSLPPGVIEDQHDDGEDFMFSFPSNVGPGEAAYVHGLMKHLFNNSNIETTPINYNGQPAEVLFPYRPTATADGVSRSATVFQRQSQEIVAIREDVVNLQYRDGEAVTHMQDTGGEWDYLIGKYQTSDDKELPLYNDSESMSDISSAFAAEIAEEEDGRNKEARTNFTESQASEVINLSIKAISSNWRQTKLPVLEARAWMIWRKTRGSRAQRDSLIGRSEVLIKHLEQRLVRMKKDMLEEEWKSRAALERQCGILEPTVFDFEEEAWKISIWERRQAPAHTLQHKSKITAKPDGSVEPNGNAAGLDHFLSDDDNINDVGSRIPTSGDEQDLVVTDPDEGSLCPGEGDDSDGRSSSSDTHITFGHASSPLPDLDTLDDAAARKDGDVEFEPADDSSDVVWPSQRTRRTARRVTDSSDLEPPNGDARKAQEVIDLVSSDDVEPPPAKRAKKQSKPNYFVAINGVTADEIEAWVYEDLRVRNDIKRLMLKILYDMDYPILLDLKENLRPPKTKDNILALLAIEAGASASSPMSSDLFAFMTREAKLYSCWLDCSEEPWKSPLDPDLMQKMGNTNQPRMFADFVKAQLPIITAMRQRRQAHLQSLSSPDRKRCPPLQLDEAPGHQGSHNKRKKEVEASEPAKATRRLAHDRQLVFEQRTLEQRSTDKSLLQQMVPGGDNEEKVLVNIMKGDEQEPIYLNDKLAARLKAHQVDGVRFIWREITSSGQEGGQGCLLAHTMGLGKTAQVIAVLTTIAETATNHRTRKQLPKNLASEPKILVLCPPSLLENWTNEIRFWSPTPTFFNLHRIDNAPAATKGFDITEFRLDVLESWHQQGGILLLGYSMFQILVSEDNKRGTFTEDEHILVRKILLEVPKIVIADEAHKLASESSALSKAAAQIRTRCRVGLTASPMSNNTQEIFALISWISPGYLGTAQEFRANFAEPIEQGTYKDSDRNERRRSLKKLEVLKYEIAPKVNRADITVLKGSLKVKTEFVLTIPLTGLQERLYTQYVDLMMKSIKDEELSNTRFFAWLAVLTLLNNHPKAFYKKLTEKKAPLKKTALNGPPSSTFAGMPSLGVAGPSALGNLRFPAATQLADTRMAGDASPMSVAVSDQEDALGDEHVSVLGITNEMVQSLLDNFPEQSLSAAVEVSHRMQLTKRIIELSEEAGDKVLLFSQRLPSLDYCEEMLNSMGVSWARIDGGKNMKLRTAILQDFANGKYAVLLISTRAGGLGLNIQQANRVIILDSGFNPTIEQQAIGRAYRLGQQKPVFVYRFVSGGTFEELMYNTQLFKTSLASRVVDKKNPARNAERKPKDWLFKPRPVSQQDIHLELGKDADVLDRIIDEAHRAGRDSFIRDIKTMETLQEEAEDDAPLDEQEKLEVEQEKLLLGSVRLGRMQGSKALPVALG